MKKHKLFFTILISCVIISGCSKKAEEVEPVGKVNGRKYTVWTTYWQTDSVFEELDYRKDLIKAISYFGAYFDEDGSLFIPEKIDEIYSKVEEKYGRNKYESYLTFVNDVLKPEGKSILKDTEILYELFFSEESTDVHIDKLISLTQEGGYHGIEIDYEGIRKDMKLWELFITFLEKLYQETSSENISLRIVLEPSTPVENLIFPDGPEYVVMCYNLYGYGTEPGPKADIQFLQALIQKMKVLPGEVSFALATGGFNFQENSEVISINEMDAIELLNIYDITPVRDEDSGSMVFRYTDEVNLVHEVWYADERTIELWSEVIEQAGDYGISLWRIGGNIIQ